VQVSDAGRETPGVVRGWIATTVKPVGLLRASRLPRYAGLIVQRAPMTHQEKSQLERINELSATARTSWLALLAFLAYIGITLLAVEDADFFVPSRRTDLPLVGISIPTFSFFLFAPPLAAALYIYLHIHLLRLWDAIADAPPRMDGEPLGEHLHPWIAKDYALGLKGGGALRPRPLRALGNLASLLLVWAAGPAVLFLFWWRSATAHDDLLTLAIAVSFFLALRAGLISLWHFRARLKRPGWGDTWDGRRWKVPLLWLAGVLLAVTSWLRTEAGLDHYVNGAIDFWEAASGRELFDPGEYPNGDEKDAQPVQEEWVASLPWIVTPDMFTFGEEDWPFSNWLHDDDPLTKNAWIPLAGIDLAGATLVPLPPDWRTPETARTAFRETWCRRQGMDMAVCDHFPVADRPLPFYALQERERWCGTHPPFQGLDCAAVFTWLDQRFRAEWEEERTSTIANLPKLDLSGRDLRRAFGAGVTLVGANASGARLEGADLVDARLESADLSGAQLARAALWGARLDGADLTRANLEGAVLEGAHLEEAILEEADLARTVFGDAWLTGANLAKARLDEADLSGAWLERADLSGAELEGTSLLKARLQGAILLGARLDGTDLSEALLVGADLVGAEIQASQAQFADFRGAKGLTQSQLDEVIGNDGTLLPDGNAPDTGQPLYVWSCWDSAPPEIDRIVAVAVDPFKGEATLRAEFVCGPDNPRRKTGTPCAVELPREECRAWAVARGLVEQD
jgi:uncharacterized protein YjbI with pentapeptide repeats